MYTRGILHFWSTYCTILFGVLVCLSIMTVFFVVHSYLRRLRIPIVHEFNSIVVICGTTTFHFRDQYQQDSLL